MRRHGRHRRCRLWRVRLEQLGRQALETRQAFASAADPVDRLYRDFVMINYGPFDIRKDMERFVETGPGGPRLPGAGFYPEDMTRDEFEARLQTILEEHGRH